MAPLTHTSYVVLAMLEQAGEATPYELKALAGSFSGLWTLRHDQVYSEPGRLVDEGLVTEKREEGGRRRRRFRLTSKGRQALEEWRRSPTSEIAELRDPGLLQLLFGAEPGPLAEAQLAAHRAKLAEYELLEAQMGPDAPAHLRRAVNAGIGHEREYVRYWGSVLGGGDGS